jgi:aminoglycoside phosphotransferase (APT) family kinase protein
VAALNPVATYIADNHERLGLDRLGVPPRPCCVMLTPRFRRSSHVIALVLDEKRQAPALVGKLPRRDRDAGGLAREAESLHAVGHALRWEAKSSVPAVLAWDEGPPRPLLLESALHGTPLSPAALRRDRRHSLAQAVAAWLERLALATVNRPDGDDWHERLVRAPLRALAASAPELRDLAERTLERCEPLLASPLPLVFEHGDLCHPNLLVREDGGVGVLDWERAQAAGLPGYDLFFFLAYAADAGRDRPACVLEAFFGRRPWAWEIAESYALELGIDRSLLWPLLAVSCARAIASGAARPRHLLLWRHALEGDPA